MNVRHLLFGKPFPTSSAHHERLDKVRGLAVFASDPISSNAYATEAIMRVLIVLGASALSLTLPIAITIGMLVMLVIISYNQTIKHYPMGGGAYMVSKDNLGRNASLLAGAAILSDYILTVAVSVSAGVKALNSAFPNVAFLHDHRVYAGLIIIAIITWLNLRGVRESGTIFALPTYAFVVGVMAVIVWGLLRYVGLVGDPLPGLPIQEVRDVPASSTNLAYLWLILRAFAGGCTALTGIEAISDGVQAFREPAPRNAIITMRAMGIMAMALFIGISFLATHIPINPENEAESVLSQLTRIVTGGGPMYYWVQFTTMLILILAANTAYADFPRIAAFLARDGFLPRWFSQLGDRLVYTTGVLVLAVLAGLLLIIFGGDEHGLLPLYAIGVFLSFTLSQAGMIRLWNKVARLQPGEELQTKVTVLHYEPKYQLKRLPSILGCILTSIVLVILTVTKFVEGAWMILIALPLMMLLFRTIRQHYDHVAKNLRVTNLSPDDLHSPADVVIVPVGDIHRGSLRAIKYALKFSDDVRIITAVDDEAGERAFKERWDTWQTVVGDAHLIFLRTEYRDYLGQVVDYIEKVSTQEFPGQLITVVVPEFMPDSKLAYTLHNQTAAQLLMRLRAYENVVVIDVPYHLRKEPALPGHHRPTPLQ